MDVDVEKLSLAARPPETVTTADHETQHQGDGDEDRVERELSVQSSPEPETMAELGAEESVGPLEQGADSDLRPSPPSASQGPDGENEEVAGRQYHTMTSVVDALRHHPGNTAFRKPMSLDFLQFSEKNSRSVGE